MKLSDLRDCPHCGQTVVKDPSGILEHLSPYDAKQCWEKRKEKKP